MSKSSINQSFDRNKVIPEKDLKESNIDAGSKTDSINMNLNKNDSEALLPIKNNNIDNYNDNYHDVEININNTINVPNMDNQ